MSYLSWAILSVFIRFYPTFLLFFFNELINFAMYRDLNAGKISWHMEKVI
jgi:hypothetical protein